VASLASDRVAGFFGSPAPGGFLPTGDSHADARPLGRAGSRRIGNGDWHCHRGTRHGQCAGRHVPEHFVARGVQWPTANRRITAASANWRGLRKRAGCMWRL
jgi:hypothetical protein